MATPIEIVRLVLQAKDNPLVTPYLDMKEESVARALFLNFRGVDDPRGMRLKDEGLLILRSMFQAWAIEYEEGFYANPKHVLYLDRHTTMPWHLKKNVLTLFEARLGMHAKLCGSMDTLVEIFGEDQKTT